MRTLGIDPSSSSTGLALIDNFNIEAVSLWRPTTKDVHKSLAEFADYLSSSNLTCHIDSMCVERVSVTCNMNTVRRIAYVEGVALSLFKSLGCSEVTQMNPSQARKIVFGKGNIGKEEIYKEIVSSNSSIDFLPFKKGGSDQTDAVVLALAMQLSTKKS